MRLTVNKALGLLLLSILFYSPFWEGRLPAQQKDSSGIMFLRLRLIGDTVSLVSATVRPGSVKQPRSAPAGEGISYQVTSTTGRVLWSGSAEDPSLRRFEYEDPDHPGQMRTKTVSVDTAEFTVRIPVLTGMENISFNRPGPAQVSRLQKVGRHGLGVISIPRKGADR